VKDSTHTVNTYALTHPKPLKSPVFASVGVLQLNPTLAQTDKE